LKIELHFWEMLLANQLRDLGGLAMAIQVK